ncbi:cytochrome c [Halovulum dunhuangense]|uniref:Cytochrome c n=1 Tax=Halovulum dunhuangense TaxID=1505036 RepID=A0A849L5T4_9RHOB|nr:cytochrome c [Halovulum dunhuangense]NNU81477.1 cytochrome c [Halovulum dunhuangense]
MLTTIGRAAGLAMAATLFALPALADEKFALGRTVFLERAEPACGICHTLADAGTSGEIGPTFASLRPSYDVVYRAITEGIGPMLPYTDHLSEEELDALAHYVSTAAAQE